MSISSGFLKRADYFRETKPLYHPRPSSRAGKKYMVYVRGEGGGKKLIHFGAEGYKHNYSEDAKKNFRARHSCDSAQKDSAKWWACNYLWNQKQSIGDKTYEKVASVALQMYMEADEFEKEAILKMLSPGLRQKITAGVGAATIGFAGAPGKALAGGVSKKLMDNKQTISRAVKGTGTYKAVRGGVKKFERAAKEKIKGGFNYSKDAVFGTPGKGMKAPAGIGGSSSLQRNGITNTLAIAAKKAKDGVQVGSKSSPVSTKLSLNKLRVSGDGWKASINKNKQIKGQYGNLSGGVGPKGNVNVAYQANPNLNVKGFTGPGGSGASFGANWSW